jgi:hypothetical protein
MPEKSKTIYDRLSEIQQTLKAPKGQYNDFAKFSYRSCEDILEAVKPLLKPGEVVILKDEAVVIGDWHYIKAVAIFSNGKEEIQVPAYARESADKKGMDDSQITGAASSYARKYALNGLFAIDDTKDADSQKPTEKKVIKNTEKILPDQKLIGNKCPVCKAVSGHSPDCPNNPKNKS